MNTVAAPMAVTNFAGGWNNVWTALTGGFPGLTQLLTIVGVIILVLAVLKWAWDRRRGGGMQGTNQIGGAAIIGSILVAPAVLFPLLLTIIDWVVNIVYTLVQRMIGS